MKNITPRQYAQSLFDVLEQHPQKMDMVVDNFITILHMNQDLKKFFEILRVLQNIFSTSGASHDVTFTTAQPVSVASAQEYEKILLQHMTISFKTRVDPSLIGGAKVRVNDRVYDATVKQRIASLFYTFVS